LGLCGIRINKKSGLLGFFLKIGYFGSLKVGEGEFYKPLF